MASWFGSTKSSISSGIGIGGGGDAVKSSSTTNNGTQAGTAATSQGSDDTPHYHFIHSMLLPSTVKVQKELRGRRFKEVQAKLGEAVMGMHVFQFDDWTTEGTPNSSSSTTATITTSIATTTAAASTRTKPLATTTTTTTASAAVAPPKSTHHSSTSSSPPAMTAATQADTEAETVVPPPPASSAPSKTNESDTAGDSGGGGGMSLDQHFSSSNQSIDGTTTSEDPNTDLESVLGDFVQAPQDDDLQPFDDDDAVSVSAATANTQTTATTAASTMDGHSTGTGTVTATPTPAVTTTTTTTPSSRTEDDPLTRLPMHRSVNDALEAYIMVMMHPQKTNMACQETLSCVKQLVLREYVSGRAGGKDDTSGSGSVLREAAPPAEGQDQTSTPPSLLHRLMMGIQKCSESNTESVQSQVIETYKVILTSRQCSVHEASVLLAIRSIFHIYLVSKSTSIQDAAKAALVDMVATIVLRMEEVEQTTATAARGNGTGNVHVNVNVNVNHNSTASSLFHTDSYYLMRSLVKLSSKELPGIDDKSTTPTNFLAQQFFTTTNVDPLALNNKVLSLELILVVMESAGDALCYGEKFVHLVQTQLCVALLKNCMSNNSQVAFVSQKIFLILVYKFKTHLRDEIQVFMRNIFLRILESDNSSFHQKALVLESLRSMCSDPQLLTQIFLNYDCDFDAMNLYNDIVFHLTKLSAKSTATPTVNMTKKELEEHTDLSLASVEVLVTVLQAFLRALDMPANNEEANDTAGQRIRQTLQLGTVGTSTPSEHLWPVLATVIPSMTPAASVEDLELMEGSSSTAMDPHGPSTVDLPHLESSSDVAGRIVDAFDRKRNAEQNFELGGVKFTLSIKSGLNFFFENGFVELDAEAIARFFLANKDKLDKTQMGEVLGKEPDAAFVKKGVSEADKGGPGFYIRILHHYIEGMDFAGMPFDDSIRLFLSGFRLPGEAQKIDRIMEKFAERFTRQNLDVFPSADTAFILAFSVIMLNTDLHNPSIKPERRMTIDSFLRNNRGIGENGTDLPDDFLKGIFNRIKERPFSLKEDDAAREKYQASSMQDSYFGGEGGGLLGFGLVGVPTTEERKRSKFKKEREEIMSATEELIGRRKRRALSTGRSVSRAVAPADVVRPMFDVTWGPIIGIMSQVMEMSSDEQSIAVCLNGFVYSIRIAAHCRMSLARDTFINSLAKFTLLGSVKEMKYKNIDAIRTLMSIAAADGEFLGESWGPVLQCISTLARMRTAASGLASDESFLEDSTRTNAKTPSKQPGSKSYFKTQTKQAKAEDTMKENEELNQRAVLETVSEQVIDQVFSSTVKLSAESLSDFMRQLVEVATAEIEGDIKRNITGVAASATASSHGEDGPSIFSLQRLVEVADYNMDVRPRLVWTQVWEILGDFFAKVGCHRNSMVSVFAIDSLKQLSSKFLEQPELSEFHFQRVFLRPFLLIMKDKTTMQDNRQLILECVDQIVSRKSHNLQSGWKILFDIVMAGAQDENDKITLMSLNILQRMLDEHLDQLTRLAKVDPELDDPSDMSAVEKRNRNSNAEDFVGMCRVSLSFIQLQENESSTPLGVSMRALCHMAIYADVIAEGRILPPVASAQTSDINALAYTYEGLEGKEALEMALWRPLLEGLASGICSQSRSRAGGVGCLVQRGSVLAMRSILLRHSALFSRKQLTCILTQTLIPAIQEAAEKDLSPVIGITSESPAITSLDFLVEPMPLPPPRYDRGLLKFEEVARSVERAPSRPLGPAELLLEACFTDMRHGGDGDLTQAYKFAKKDMTPNADGEQPFPDSWVATTAPVALGCLTDIASEIIIPQHGAEGAIFIWPCVGDLIQRWCNGNLRVENGRHVQSGWAPCEALVRIATQEIIRFSSRLADRISHLDRPDAEVWANAFVNYFTDTLNQTLDMENDVKKQLLQGKIRAYKHARREEGSVDSAASSVDSFIADDEMVDRITPYGKGVLINRRMNGYGSTNRMKMDVVKLSFGVLYSPSTDQPQSAVAFHPRPVSTKEHVSSPTSSDEQTGESFEWVKLVPILKVRCIAAHFLHQVLTSMKEETLISFLAEEMAQTLLISLGRSRDMAEKAVKNEDLAHAFQEAILSEWGNDDEMGEEALVNIARLSQTQGSPMFFFTQSAGATHATIRLLSALYEFKIESPEDKAWDRETFAAPHLLTLIKDVLTKFVESETKEGHRIDPNVWRNSTGSGVKVAIYCTSYASVVVGLLNAMLSFDDRHMALHGPAFFPMICRLVPVQSDEIRQLVQRLLLERFTPLLITTSNSNGGIGR